VATTEKRNLIPTILVEELITKIILVIIKIRGSAFTLEKTRRASCS
jgi:hypothetical protein